VINTRSLLLLFFLFIVCKVNSQEKYFSISASPVVLYLPGLASGVQTGVHYYFKEHWSASSELAFPFSQHEDSSQMNPKYVRISIELKYFKRKHSNKSSSYVSISSFIIRRSFEVQRGGVYYKERDTVSYQYNRAKVSSPVFTITPKLGFEINLNRIKIDMFAGAGLRIIATSYKNVQGVNSVPSIESICKIFPSPDPAHWFNETLFRPQFSAGFRLHFILPEK
jgi:hypothetical protein